MTLPLKIELDLDKIWTGDEWGTTIGEIVREEIISIVRAELKKSLKESTDLKKAIATLRKKAADNILKELSNE